MSDRKNGIDLGDGKVFEPEILTALSEASNSNFAVRELYAFAKDRWQFNEETQEYGIDTLKTRKERSFFNGIYWKMYAILASDANGVFESIGQLVNLAKDKAEDFNQIYKVAVAANPTLDRESQSEEEAKKKD